MELARITVRIIFRVRVIAFRVRVSVPWKSVTNPTGVPSPPVMAACAGTCTHINASTCIHVNLYSGYMYITPLVLDLEITTVFGNRGVRMFIQLDPQRLQIRMHVTKYRFLSIDGHST